MGSGGLVLARILVIDDSSEIRVSLRKMLEVAGHKIIEASNGEEGVRLYSQNPTDLIITDILMPDKDGIEALLELRTDFPDIKVIVISGKGKELLPTASEFGARRVFEKPFRVQEILSAVKELLGE